jgi:F-type H+-transporting ATPase subunit a
VTFYPLLNKLILVAQEGAEAAGHAAETEKQGKPEIPSVVTFISKGFAEHYQVFVFALFIAVVMVIGSMILYRRRQLIPGPFQNFVEMLIEWLYDLVHAMLGKETNRYFPFLGTLFVYIWFMNLLGIIPFFNSPTSNHNITISLGVTVFLYVQYTALTRLGPWKYFLHLLGDPHSGVEWALTPLNFVLHTLGEFIKPVSLAARLYGNIMGEDILIAAMALLGIMALSFFKSPVGIPFQLPFYFLAMLTSTIQALVFTLLTTSYFMMILPHEEHH